MESALQVVRLEGGTLYQATKEGARGIVTAAGEKTAQLGEKITLTADQIGAKIAERTAGESTTIAAADTGNIFKITIKHPGITEACEKIVANPLKMDIVKDAGKAGAQAVKKANEEATLAGTALKLPENVVKAMEEIAERPVEAAIIKEAGNAGSQTAEKAAISTGTNAELVGSGSILRNVDFSQGLNHARINHFFGDSSHSLKILDPTGTPEKWSNYLVNLAQSGEGNSKTIPNWRNAGNYEKNACKRRT